LFNVFGAAIHLPQLHFSPPWPAGLLRNRICHGTTTHRSIHQHLITQPSTTATLHIYLDGDRLRALNTSTFASARSMPRNLPRVLNRPHFGVSPSRASPVRHRSSDRPWWGEGGGIASKTEASTGVYRFLFPSRQYLRNEQCFHSQCPHTCLLRATPCTSRSPRLDSTQRLLARNLVREHMYPFSQPRRCTAA
jgi:hypothetical protein